MRTSHLLLISLLFLFCGTGYMNAQSGKLKSANNRMEILDYMGAIQEYNKILAKDDIAEAKINLAECYSKVSDIDNAEYWYGQVVRLPEAEPIHYLKYGYMLQRNGKCDMAREWFQKFVEAVPDDSRGRHLLRACDYRQELEQKNAGIYEVDHMPFNSGLDDFSPMFYGDGLVFASETFQQGPSKRLHCWTGNPFLELMYVDGDSDSTQCLADFGDPEKFSNSLNSKYHDAAVSFGEEDNTIYFTRNNLLNGKARKDDEGIIRLKIYSAEGSGGEGSTSFSNLESLPFNSDEYSVAHPALSPDGQYLYFASDMPGGFGGMDLYVSESEDGRWGPPINLGPKVNTEGHEVFPFYGHDDNLYFASDGQVGLGGLDIYQMQKKKEFNEWGDIINLGAPVNTVDDDFGFIINKDRTCGCFSSDREGGFGDDDIYCYRRNAATLELLVYDEKTGEPIEGAEVVSDCTGNTYYTDAEGKAIIEQKLNQCCTFSASKETYEDNAKEGCTTGMASGETKVVEIPLTKPVDCLLTGTVTSGGSVLTNHPVIIKGDCVEGGSYTVMTDDNGSYAYQLIENCAYTVSARKAGFIGGSEQSFNTNDPTNCSFIKNFNLAPPTLPAQPDYSSVTDTRNTTTTTYPSTTTTTYPTTTYPSTTTTTTYPSTTYTTGTTTTTYPSSTTSGWSSTDIVNQAAGSDPLVCCSMYEGLSGSFGTLEVSPSVKYTQPGEPLPYLLHIYYDFDQSYIRDDAVSELSKLLGMMNENPSVIVEIGSHTDSRGSNKYNDRLSQRRSESVVRWLKEQGIPASRLQAQGYGESMNVNNCINNVPCSEQEHQLNRRTEFRIVGLTDGTRYSTPRNNVDGKGCEGCPF